MFELIESCPDQRPGFGWTGKLVSLTIHAFVVSAALALTEHVVAGSVDHPRADSGLVWVTPPMPQRISRPPMIEGSPPTPLLAPATWHELVPPVAIPPDIPLPGSASFTEPGVHETTAPGPVTGLEPSGLPVAGSAPREVRAVDEPPILLSHPAIHYPEALRQAGIEGRVLVETVLDSLGRAEPALTRVTPGGTEPFDREAVRVVLASRYRPARVAGHAVRVRIAVPVSFTILR